MRKKNFRGLAAGVMVALFTLSGCSADAVMDMEWTQGSQETSVNGETTDRENENETTKREELENGEVTKIHETTAEQEHTENQEKTKVQETAEEQDITEKQNTTEKQDFEEDRETTKMTASENSDKETQKETTKGQTSKKETQKETTTAQTTTKAHKKETTTVQTSEKETQKDKDSEDVWEETTHEVEAVAEEEEAPTKEIAAKPATEKPSSTKPGASQSTAANSTETKPVTTTTQTTTAKPVATQVVSSKPAVTKPAAATITAVSTTAASTTAATTTAASTTAASTTAATTTAASTKAPTTAATTTAVSTTTAPTTAAPTTAASTTAGTTTVAPTTAAPTTAAPTTAAPTTAAPTTAAPTTAAPTTAAPTTAAPTTAAPTTAAPTTAAPATTQAPRGDGGVMRTGMTSQKFRDEMGVGINLGNTMDAYWSSDSRTNSGSQLIGQNTPTNYETCWGGRVVTQSMIDSLKASGFNTVRIPVYWGNMMAEDGTFTIDRDYLARVGEIIDYCRQDGMYVVINIHHYDEYIIKNYPKDQALTIFKNLWSQIAAYYKDYSDYLIFEGFNENVGSTYSGESLSENQIYAYANALNQTFVNAVRRTGGNNASRMLIVSGYWTNIDKTTDSRFQMPTDSVSDRLMVSVHYVDNACYWSNNVGGQSWLDYSRSQCELLKKAFTDQGIVVFVGECTASYESTRFASNAIYKDSAGCTAKLLSMIMDYGFVPVFWDTTGSFYADSSSQAVRNDLQSAIKQVSAK